MRKRFLSALLALCLMLSLVPTAWASGGTVDPPVVSGDCGADAHWIFTADNGILRISGSGDMTDYTATSAAPWQTYASSITTVIIEKSVSSIGSNAFAGCTNLTAVTIPDTVTKIGSAAFLSCTSLGRINYEGTQEKWDTVTKADNVIPDGVTVVPADEVPTTSGSCGPGVYWDLADDGTLNISGSGPIVIENGRAPWASVRDQIKHIIISSGVTGIGGAAFLGCTNLEDVLIPVTVTEIGGGAFAGITDDVEVRYAGNATQWGEIGGNGKDDISSAKIEVQFEYVPLMLTFGPGAATAGTTFQKDTLPGRTFLLPDKGTDFEAPPASTGTGKKEFRGWLVTLNGKELLYPVGYPLQVEQDTVFTAWWDEPSSGTNTINFYSKYNNEPELFEDTTIPQVTFEISAKDQVVPLGNPSRANYTFVGWTTLEDQTTFVDNIIIPAGRGGAFMYVAHWKGQPVNITVIGPNGGTYSSVETAASPEPVPIPVEVPTAPGMTWEITRKLPDTAIKEYTDAAPDSSEAMVTVAENFAGNIVLYGEFKPNTYDITWDANGGTWGPDADDKEVTTQTEKDAYTYSADDDNETDGNYTGDAPTRRGYDLAGWTSSDPDKPVKSEKDENGNILVTIPAGTFGDLTLMADWDIHEYTVTWEAGEGAYWSKDNTGNEDTDPKETTYTVDDTSITHTPPTRDGYTFAGWEGTAKNVDGEEINLTSSEEDLNTVLRKTEEMEVELGDLTLTAVWKKNITIKFEAGDENATGEMKDVPTHEGAEYQIPVCGFTAPEGKEFAGWLISSDPDGGPYPVLVPDPDSEDPENPKMIPNTYLIPDPYTDTEITFTAVWEDKKFTITIVPNNGTDEKNQTREVVYGDPFKLAHPSTFGFTTPTGMVFAYWEVEGQQAQFKEDSSIPHVYQDTTITAHWVNDQYTVTYQPGNGEGEEWKDPASYQYGDLVKLKDKDELGYTAPPVDPDDPDAKPLVFIGWEVNGTEYLPGATIPMEGSITATAVWVDESEVDTYKIIYQPGGGQGEAVEKEFSVRKGSAPMTALPGNDYGFTFDDMTFVGWTVTKKTQDYKKPGTSVALNSETIAVACWQGEIVYMNGGNIEGPTSYIYSEDDTELQFIPPTPSIIGKIFDKWTWDRDEVAVFGPYLELPAGFSGTLTLTAHWLDDEGVYLITFDPNGGTGEMSPVTVARPEEEGEAAVYTLPACGFEPPVGMEFDCWLVGEASYQPGAKITVVGNTTVTAQWKKKDVDPDAEDCTVTYLPGEGTGDPIVETEHKVGEWLVLPDCTFTAPENKEFDAWDKGKPGEEICLEGDTTITALWKDKEPEPDDPNKPKIWTITFDANGGTGTMASIEVSQVEGGAAYTLPACAFTAPEGKVFQAWQVGAEECNPGTTITITGDTTIKALWKDAPVKPGKPTNYKITYNLNGGYMTGSGPSSYNVSTEAQTITVPVPYKAGYTFLGWTYSGVSKPTKTVTIRANMTGDLTVVANWQINPGTGTGVNGSPEQGNYIAVSTTAGGDIRIPYEYAVQNAVVTFQAQPQAGFAVGTVSVKNSQGWDVGDLRDLGGGNYSFTMPNYRVNISATFVQQSAAAGPIAKPVMNYDDVRLGDWYYNSVEYVYNRNMMSGVSATQFGPNGEASRGVIWTALAAHAGFDINGGATWFERGQYWAVNRGITDGASPSAAITREQLVTMLWRYKGNPTAFGGDLSQFVDGYTVSGYAMDAMRWAVSTGLMGGANGRLNPQATTTRAEAATILARFCQNM